jgi:hypothetical protein
MCKTYHNYKLPNNNRYRDSSILMHEVNSKIRFTSQLQFCQKNSCVALWLSISLSLTSTPSSSDSGPRRPSQQHFDPLLIEDTQVSQRRPKLSSVAANMIPYCTKQPVVRHCPKKSMLLHRPPKHFQWIAEITDSKFSLRSRILH